jgi:Zn-dependent protease with chaperone function
MDATANAPATSCPRCRAALVAHPDHSAWCESCGWNADPTQPDAQLPRRGPADATAPGDAPRARLSAAKIGAYALSFAVHAVTLLLAVAGILLSYVALTRNLVLLLLALPLLAMAWLFRPRFPQIGSSPELESNIRNLRRLVDDVARAVGTRSADAIVVDGSFSVSAAAFGWRRSRVLTVGLPLFAVLSPQERVAVLAHELAHFKSGDPRRGVFIGGALQSLAAWQNLLAPRSASEGVVRRISTDPNQPYAVSTGPGLAGFATVGVNGVLYAVSWIPRGASRLLTNLTGRDTLRAEYFADELAVKVAGSQAVISSFDKRRMLRMYSNAVSVMTPSRWRNGSLWEELRARASEYPDSENRRTRTADRATLAKFEPLHPPTALRLAAIERRGIVPAQLVAGEGASQAVDADLQRSLSRVQSEVIDRHLDSIHRG